VTNKQYQEMVEEKFKKPLKEIMYDLCVVRQVVPVEGASILDVPKKTFIAWRANYQFGPLQIRANYAKEIRTKQNKEYSDQLQTVDLTRPFILPYDHSLSGFREIIERYLELYKAERTLETDSLEELAIMLKIASFEQILTHIDDYLAGSLFDKFYSEAQLTKRRMEQR
jgi:hypothetical protein